MCRRSGICVVVAQGLGGETVGMERKHQSLISFLESKTQRSCLCSAESKAENQRGGEEGTRSREQSRGPLEGKQLSSATTSARGASAAQQTETHTRYIIVKCIFKVVDSYCSSVRFKITILVLVFFFFLMYGLSALNHYVRWIIFANICWDLVK